MKQPDSSREKILAKLIRIDPLRRALGKRDEDIDAQAWEGFCAWDEAFDREAEEQVDLASENLGEVVVRLAAAMMIVRVLAAGYQLAARKYIRRDAGEGKTTEEVTLRKVIDNFTVELAVNARRDGVCDLIVGITRAGVSEEGIRVEVGDELRHTGPDGIAMFENLREGRYQLQIIDQNREVLESTWVTLEAEANLSTPTDA